MKTINTMRALAILERWSVPFSIEYIAEQKVYRFSIEGSRVADAPTMIEAVLVGLAQSLVEARTFEKPAEQTPQEWIDKTIAAGDVEPMPIGVVEQAPSAEFLCAVPGRNGWTSVKIVRKRGLMVVVKLAAPLDEESLAEWVIAPSRFHPSVQAAVTKFLQENVETISTEEFVDRCQCKRLPCVCAEKSE